MVETEIKHKFYYVLNCLCKEGKKLIKAVLF